MGWELKKWSGRYWSNVWSTRQEETSAMCAFPRSCVSWKTKTLDHWIREESSWTCADTVHAGGSWRSRTNERKRARAEEGKGGSCSETKGNTSWRPERRPWRTETRVAKSNNTFLWFPPGFTSRGSRNGVPQRLITYIESFFWWTSRFKISPN